SSGLPEVSSGDPGNSVKARPPAIPITLVPDRAGRGASVKEPAMFRRIADGALGSSRPAIAPTLGVGGVLTCLGLALGAPRCVPAAEDRGMRNAASTPSHDMSAHMDPPTGMPPHAGPAAIPTPPASTVPAIGNPATPSLVD